MKDLDKPLEKQPEFVITENRPKQSRTVTLNLHFLLLIDDLSNQAEVMTEWAKAEVRAIMTAGKQKIIF